MANSLVNSNSWVHLSRAERRDAGRALRTRVPRENHADCPPAAERDLVAILAETDVPRIPALLPIRYQRMTKSPFYFLRGAAAVLARDLAQLPQIGAPVQACGDCHLMNFGTFYTPEGRVLFDINDFDETLPGVDFIVDLKRLVASVADVINYGVIHKHIAELECQQNLDFLLAQKWTNTFGREVGIALTAIDAGAWADDVLSYCKRHSPYKLIAVRGIGSEVAPRIARVQRERNERLGTLVKYSGRFYNVGSSVLKMALYRDLAKDDPAEPVL